MTRISRKTFFLTYSQANNLTKELIINHIKSVGQPIKTIVAEEEHQDGGKHFHALIGYRLCYDVRDMTVFDVDGIHPNIQPARSWRRVLEYVTKDGNYINEGWEIDEPQQSIVQTVIELIDRGLEHNEVVRETVIQQGDKGLRLISQIDSFVAMCKRPNAKKEPVRKLSEFNLPAHMIPWIQRFIADVAVGFGDRGERKSLWLFGPSRLGKTQLARSIGVHWYMNGFWNVECYDDDASYGVIDDIDWDQMRKYYKGLMGLQQDVTVTDKYKKKIVIKGGKPVIVLSNKLPEFTDEEKEWLNENMNFCAVNIKLWAEEGFAQVFDIASSE